MISKNKPNSFAPSSSINELSPIHNVQFHKTMRFDSNLKNEPTVSVNYQNNKYSKTSQIKNYNQSSNKQQQNYSNEKQKYQQKIRSVSNKNSSADKYYNSRDVSEKRNQNEESPGFLNEKYGLRGRKEEFNQEEQRNSLLLKSYDKYDRMLDGEDRRRERGGMSKIDSLLYSSLEKQNPSQMSPVFHEKQKNSPPPPLPTSLPSEYQLLLQYQLKRQNQKNEILQKRLSNKEDFIQEMKNIQQDLTLAYAKCQEELNNANKVIYEMEMKGTKQIRDYKEEIGELKHQIMLLEKQVNERALLREKEQQPSRKKAMSQQQPKKSSSIAVVNRNHLQTNNNNSNLVNDSFKNRIEQQRRYIKSQSTANLTRHKSTGEVDFRAFTKNSTTNLQATPLNSQFSSISHQYPNQQPHNTQNDDKNNLMNTFKPLSLMPLSQISSFQTEIISNLPKVSNFLEHFINMCRKMLDVEAEGKENPQQKNRLIHDLKRYWKWIKEVIKEWKEFKDHQHRQHHNQTANFVKKALKPSTQSLRNEKNHHQSIESHHHGNTNQQVYEIDKNLIIQNVFKNNNENEGSRYLEGHQQQKEQQDAANKHYEGHSID